MSANCTTGDVRLADGPTSNTGRVEVCINKVWASICHNAFGTDEGNVVCGQLGYLNIGETRHNLSMHSLQLITTYRCKSSKRGILWPRLRSCHRIFQLQGW